MHCCDLVELGGVIAVRATDFVRSSESFPTGSLETYWATSRCRLNRWGRFLKDASVALQTQRRTKFLWRAIRPGLEEILASELFTRVFAAAGMAHDIYHGRQEAGPVMASVMAGHLEARKRTLELLMLEQNGVSGRLNRLRRRVERWTDLCLAHFAPMVDLHRWVFHEERAQQFALDLAEEEPDAASSAASAVLLAALRACFAAELVPEPANPDLNQPLAVAVLRCLPADLFGGRGAATTAWLQRVEDRADDTQAMLDQLLALEDASMARADSPVRFSPGQEFGWN
jgi:hypothetical protein